MFRRSESTAPGRAPTAGAAWLAVGLLATLATTSAQDAGAELTPLELFGSAEWLIESVSSGGETLEPGAEVPTELRLVVDLPALAGTAGCNRMTAHFELGPGAGAIDFEPIVATLMACPEHAMAQERTVFDAL